METNFDAKILESQRVDPSFDEEILHQVLRIAVYDEYHAYNTYLKVINTFGEIKPFVNIIQAEIRHYTSLIVLLEKYNVAIPVDDWYEKIEIPQKMQECCEMGVAGEIKNIKMYDNLLKYTSEYPDVTDTLYKLQAASYNNHLPAFRKCVQEYSPSQAQDINNTMINDFSEIAKKISTGEMNQEELMKLLTNTNMSFVGGILLGGVSAGVLSSMIDKNEEEGE